jgi:hypothetical protein
MSTKDGSKNDGEHDRRDAHARDGGIRPVDQAVARWIHRLPGGAAPEDRAAELLRRASVAPPFGQQARMRVHARLAAETTRAANAERTSLAPGRQSRGRATALHWGIAASLLLGSGVVIAARGVDHWWKAGPSATSRPPPAPERSGLQRPSRGQRPRDHVSGVVATESLMREGVAAPPGAAEAPLPVPSPVAVVVPNPVSRSVGNVAVSDAPAFAPARESKLAMEARLLDGALGRLRQGRDADRALQELDHYLSRFPGGILAVEARAARVDALLMLGHEPEALVALNALPLDGGGRDQELRVIRGELGAASDCARAILDFDQVLATTASSSDLAERALYGRAVCRSRQGQKDEARRDAARYIERFPRGRFTREAHWLIASGGGDAREIDPGRRGP